jgi:hypothetical protein
MTTPESTTKQSLCIYLCQYDPSMMTERSEKMPAQAGMINMIL